MTLLPKCVQSQQFDCSSLPHDTPWPVSRACERNVFFEAPKSAISNSATGLVSTDTASDSKSFIPRSSCGFSQVLARNCKTAGILEVIGYPIAVNVWMKPDSTGLAPNHGTKPWLLVSVGSVGQLHWLTRSRNCAPIVRTSVPCPSCTTARFAMTRTMRLTRNSKNTTTLWRTRCGHRQNPWTLELSQQPGCDAVSAVSSSHNWHVFSFKENN